MITTERFRAAEAMLLAAKTPSAEALMTTIALAIETMTPTPHPDEVREAEPIVLRLAMLADRLGWDVLGSVNNMREANGDILEHLGFSIGSCNTNGNEDDDRPWFQEKVVSTSHFGVTLSPTLEAIVRGTALIEVATNDRRAMAVDAGSSAMVDLVSRLSAVGGACLYREADTAGERVPELMAVAATIAAGPSQMAGVVVHDCTDHGRLAVPPAAALLAAVLHGACVLVTTDALVDPPKRQDEPGAGEEDFDGKLTKAATAWCPLTSDGSRLAAMLPHAPLAVIVPIPRDAVLMPRHAAAFVTAIGPLRRDRAAAGTTLRDMAEDRLSDAVSDRLVDLWSGRAEHARTSLDAVSRMIDGDKKSISARGKAKPNQTVRKALGSEAFSAMADAMMRGLAPHVWSPVALKPKTKSATFFRELFVCEPDAGLLFSERLRDEPGIRILLVGIPGTGKSAAASHIASSVLGMPHLDLKASDVFFHRLGALERAIAGAFQQARDLSAVLIIDEADSLVQDRATASPGSLHLVTAITNTILLELDRHELPVIVATNFADRIDPAVRRRLDLTVEVKPIPEELELRALRLLLDLDPPSCFAGFGGDTVISDYAGAKRIVRLQGGGAETAIAAVQRARDVRLGRHAKERKKIGF